MKLSLFILTYPPQEIGELAAHLVAVLIESGILVYKSVMQVAIPPHNSFNFTELSHEDMEAFKTLDMNTSSFWLGERKSDDQ